MKAIGKINIPQEAFIKVLKTGTDPGSPFAPAFPEKKAGKPGAVAKERQGGKNRLRNLRQGSSIPGCEEAPVMLSDRA